jgi:hypothetical protein
MHRTGGGVAGPAKQPSGNGMSKLKTVCHRSRISGLQKEFVDSWGWHFYQTRRAPAKGWQPVTFLLLLPPVVPGRGSWPGPQSGPLIPLK